MKLHEILDIFEEDDASYLLVIWPIILIILVPMTLWIWIGGNAMMFFKRFYEK